MSELKLYKREGLRKLTDLQTAVEYELDNPSVANPENRLIARLAHDMVKAGLTDPLDVFQALGVNWTYTEVDCA